MFSNRYTVIYATIMVVVVAAALAVTAEKLKPLQQKNIQIEKMQNILTSANIKTTVKDAEAMYAKYITQTLVVNNKGAEVANAKAFDIDLYYELKEKPENRKLPVYICSQDNGEKNYIVPLRGKGLWGPVWGYICFKSDFNTIVGTMFDHKGETPGLGAEISETAFQEQFKNKSIFDEQGNFTSVDVIKGGAAPDNAHGVDAISGGTITSKGVSEMIKNCLTDYIEYFKANKISK